MTEQEAIKALKTEEALFVAYSRATNLPYVTCDEENFNDQAWIFTREEDIKEFGKTAAENKNVILGMKFERKNFPMLYSTLHAMGVNSIVLQDGKGSVEVELDDVTKMQDLSKLPPEKRPLFNPSLQLSAAYFLQELRRPVPKDQHGNIRELEEEVLANLIRSEFLIAVTPDEKDPKKLNMAAIKTKDGKTLQPFFSEVIEFGRFSRGKKIGAVKVAFEKLPQVSIKSAEGYVLNPMGYNLMFDKERFEKLIELKKKVQETPES